MEKADKELKSLLCSNDQKKEDLNIETVREGGPCIEMVTTACTKCVIR